MKIFYVYAHKRKDNGEVFYIGKGSHRRAWSKAGRTTLWRFIANQSGFNIEILKEKLTEKQAYSLEEKLIDKYGRLTKGNGCLTNVMSGHNDTSYLDSKKAKIDNKKKYLLVNVTTLEKKYFTYPQMTNSGINYKRVIVNGRMSAGWISNKTFKTHGHEYYKNFLERRKDNQEIRTFVNRDSFDKFTGTTKEFMIYSKIGQRAWSLVNGKIKTAYGWYIE